MYSKILERSMGKRLITWLDHSKHIKKYQKVVLDLAFIKICKKEELILTFAKLDLSVIHGSPKLKKRISRIIMENDMQMILNIKSRRNWRKKPKRLAYNQGSTNNISLYHATISIQGIWNVIHNFSSYTLSDDESMALNYGLDQHMSQTVTYNFINREFELFYQSILRNIFHLPSISISISSISIFEIPHILKRNEETLVINTAK